MSELQPTALTLRCPENNRVFASDVRVCEAFDPQSGLDHPPTDQYIGIWDTGATGSAITKKVVTDLKLQSIDSVPVGTAKGIRPSDVYLVNILLPSNVGFKALRVTEADLADADVLIGMDIICLGDFAITHEEEGNGVLVMSYRTPPNTSRTIDFVKEINSRIPMEKSRAERLGRRKGKRTKRNQRG